MLSRLPRGRIWLAIAAVILVTLSLVPPAGSYARRYVFAESLQFVLFATAVPALLVLGAPWRLLGLPRLAAGRGLARRPTPRRPAGNGFLRGAAILLAYMGTLIAWRLPVTVNALATQTGLAVAEMATLAVAGTALWLQLVESPPLLPRLSRPLRAVFAALAMWTIWILAYRSRRVRHRLDLAERHVGSGRGVPRDRPGPAPASGAQVAPSSARLEYPVGLNASGRRRTAAAAIHRVHGRCQGFS